MPGGYFGDIEVIKQTSRLHSDKCEEKCSLLIMNHEVLDEIKDRFEDAWKDLESHANENLKLLTMLKRNILEIREVDKYAIGVSNLKDAMEFIEPFIQKEFENQENWSIATELKSNEALALDNLKATEESIQKMNAMDESLNTAIDNILDKLSQRRSARDSSVSSSKTQELEVPTFTFDN